MSIATHVLSHQIVERTRSSRDIGPERELLTSFDWSMARGAGCIDLRVRYRVDYPSMFHRGNGRDPEVHVLNVEAMRNGDWAPLDPFDGLLDAIRDEIEEEEQLNFAYCGD